MVSTKTTDTSQRELTSQNKLEHLIPYGKKKPENNASKVDIAVMDKEKKTWLLIEGTVCGIGLISDRWKTK